MRDPKMVIPFINSAAQKALDQNRFPKIRHHTCRTLAYSPKFS